MNTTPPSDTPSYPSLQPSWHKMIRRCRAGDRAIALQLCRAAYRARNGGRFPALREHSDAELGERLGLSLRRVRRLRESSPLWRWEGSDLLLFFVGAPETAGQPTPECYGRRRARHAARAAQRRRRTTRRARLQVPPAEYPLLDGGDLLAAEDDACSGPEA